MSVVDFKQPAGASQQQAGKRTWLRFVTAASLFDGHDAAINIMRRILQASGAEVIHLAHNRSVQEIVEAAIQEDADAIAISSYQGGHIEYFKYLIDRLREFGAGHIKIFGGGGGVIIPAEIDELHNYGVTRIYSPADGQTIGLQGMIDDMLVRCHTGQQRPEAPAIEDLSKGDRLLLTRAITALENDKYSSVDIEKLATLSQATT
ncbi:MAG: methylmalonyl-CoA mutase, partial [Pseudohongiellaceae bacterium]